MTNLHFGALALAGALFFSEDSAPAAFVTQPVNPVSASLTTLSSLAITTFDGKGAEGETSDASDQPGAIFASYWGGPFNPAVVRPNVPVAPVPEPVSYGIVTGVALGLVVLRRQFLRRGQVPAQKV
jgi:hypothetical protein